MRVQSGRAKRERLHRSISRHERGESQRALDTGKDPSIIGHLPHLPVNAFDRVGGVDQPPKWRAEAPERQKVRPRLAPAGKQSRIAAGVALAGGLKRCHEWRGSVGRGRTLNGSSHPAYRPSSACRTRPSPSSVSRSCWICLRRP